MDKLAYASEILIDEINKKKEELHLTNAQLSEKCDVVESTLTKILNHSSKNPGFNILTRIATSIGISVDEVLSRTIDKAVEKNAAATSIPAKMLVSQEDKFLNLFIETHDKQINDLKEQISIKDRWIKALAAILIVCTLVFAFIAVYDITHPGAGLIRTAESGDTIE